MALFTKGKKALSYAIQNGAVHRRFVCPVFLYGGLDHSELQNDEG